MRCLKRQSQTIRWLNGLLGCVVLMIGVGLLVSCEQTKPPVEATVATIAIKAETVPETVAYHRFNLEEIILIVTYSDGTERELSLQTSMFSADDLARLNGPGAHTLTVNYASLETVFDIVLDIPIPELVQVGEAGVTYTVPTGFNSTPRPVEGGFYMAKTETTYALWYAVRIWAEAEGYHFQNLGQEGSRGAIGQAPSHALFHPVTKVSWFDTIVWLNALSEHQGLEPVYRDLAGHILRDSRNSQIAILEQVVRTNHPGYRLPSPYEWDMAARWKNDTTSTYGSELVGERYWTPRNYASGALTSVDDIGATRAVAWFRGASGGDMTRPVGLLGPNHLGLYDMSGNVWEWTDFRNSFGDSQALGASYYEAASSVMVAMPFSTAPTSTWSIIGFRIVRGPDVE
ncbi:MAG: hypothetical protein EA374_04180 [Acholeplasmatales bacterium]|nr:MAG: hypothetical protein EA374_04180 [Acholeplasmatales bacterium]